MLTDDTRALLRDYETQARASAHAHPATALLGAAFVRRALRALDRIDAELGAVQATDPAWLATAGRHLPTVRLIHAAGEALQASRRANEARQATIEALQRQLAEMSTPSGLYRLRFDGTEPR